MICKAPDEVFKNDIQEAFAKVAKEAAATGFVDGWQSAIKALVKIGHHDAAIILEDALGGYIASVESLKRPDR